MCRQRAGAVLLIATGALGGCAVNPATGGRELMLVSEQQEIAMGQEADPGIVAEMGLYPDSQMQALVARIGADLAGRAERPNLPWTFRVVDDPVVNAFALPGGYIYVTRGILAHFASEAELASVLGHEIGHVTARHSAAQVTRQQLAGLGLGIGAILVPGATDLLGLAQGGLGLLFLKFGRDDESQADELGFRYLLRAQYDVREMPKVFRMLGRASALSGGGRIPEWQSTHPDPENRERRTQEAVARLAAGGQSLDGYRVERASYLRRLDGMVFGPNPREGFFRENAFYHPDLAFQFVFPQGWRQANLKQAVIGMSQEKDVMVQITVAKEKTPAAASQAFFSQEGVQRELAWRTSINGLPAASGGFAAAVEGGTVRGLVAFVAHGNLVYRLLGYASAERWATHRSAVEGALGSFARVTDRAVLDVQPDRLRLVTLDRSMSFAEFTQRYPSAAAAELVAVINGVEPTDQLPAGAVMKRVAASGTR